MKLLEIVAQLDKSDKNSEYVDISQLAYQEFNISEYSFKQNTQLKCYWIATHYCTDTYVGIRAYFMEDIFVAFSYQSGRKSPENFEWVSKELYKHTKDYIRSLTEDEEDTPSLINLEEEFGEFYPIHYAGQFIKKDVLLEDNLVEIIKQKQYEFEEPSVLVKLVDGTEKWVYPTDLKTPYNLIK